MCLKTQTEALPTKLYRYESELDVVVLREFKIIKHTKCGFWIAKSHWSYQWTGSKKFVLSTGRKRFAYPSEPEARESFLQRKRRQIAILTARLEDIEASVKALNENRIADYSETRYFDF